MKKTGIILICTLLTVLSCILFAGCSNKEKVSSIELKDSGSGTVIEAEIGKLDYSDYTLLVTYNSGSVVELALSEDMISELDRLKLYQPGEHIITVSYGGCTCEVSFLIKRASFGELRFPENTVFTYNGKAHTVEVEGELPANANVSYLGGNSFTNAGSYDVTAVITCNGYETVRLTTTVTVERAKYDMSGVSFDAKEATYNGMAHSVAISGQLPKGVSAPTYYIDGNKTASAVDAGEYEASAVFAVTDPNYEPIPTMKTTLKINPAEYRLDGVDLIFANDGGVSALGSMKVYDGKEVIFDIDVRTAMADDLTVSFSIMNGNGELISNSNANTNIKNVGKYTVKVDFVPFNSKNYQPIEPMEFEFNVLKARYDVSDVIFESASAAYDGTVHSLTARIPEELTEAGIQVSYQYSRNSEIILDNGQNVSGVRDAGEYVVTAIFTITDPNYEQIEPIDARLVIEPKELSLVGFDFAAGNAKKIRVGETVDVIFEVGDSTGVTVTATLYKIGDDGDVLLEQTQLPTGGASGEVSVNFNNPELSIGSYLCVVTVSVQNNNHVLSNGNSNADYYFNFEVLA